MPNRNYVNGRSREYRILKQLKDIGCDITFRSAGSHSAIDCVGIDVKKKVIYLFQSKPKSMSEKAKAKIQVELSPLNDEFIVVAKVL